MEKLFKNVLYGGDYNPEQWERSIWNEDMEIFKNVAINTASINIFAWSKLQPSEEVYDFSELDAIVEMLTKENMSIILATSTAAMPAWLFKKYPEVARATYEGLTNKFGSRHNFCPSSPAYRKFAKQLTEKIVDRYGHHPNIVCWHVNNEYNGKCYCPKCEVAFREWLEKKYETLDNLNEAWNMDFWSHRVYEWDEIVLPNARSDGFREHQPYFAGIAIDYARFNSDNLLELFVMERDIIKASGSKAPVTTNFMGTYKWLNYFKWAKELDIISWDNYPAYDTPWFEVAMNHDLMRGLKNQSFMLMEQTPSQQNYQPYNALKRPGQLRAQSYQTLAHGADAILYFQLRQSRGACEKFHGAVIEHSGRRDTRVLQEVGQIGHELESFEDKFVGTTIKSKVGIIFDWESYWGLEYTSGPTKDLTYVKQIQNYYKAFYKKNIPVDLISVDSEFSEYEFVIAPVLYMVEEELKLKLEEFVESGGTFLTTFMSGIVNQSDNVHLGGYPGPLKKLCGIWVEEIDALAPNSANTFEYLDGTSFDCTLLCDLIHLEGASSIANYTSDFYVGRPTITKNDFGDGNAFYVGSLLEEKALEKLLEEICQELEIGSVINELTELEITCRENEIAKYYFIMNFKDDAQKIPNFFIGEKDLITQETLTKETSLNKYDVLLVQEIK